MRLDLRVVTAMMLYLAGMENEFTSPTYSRKPRRCSNLMLFRVPWRRARMLAFLILGGPAGLCFHTIQSPERRGHRRAARTWLMGGPQKLLLSPRAASGFIFAKSPRNSACWARWSSSRCS